MIKKIYIADFLWDIFPEASRRCNIKAYKAFLINIL